MKHTSILLTVLALTLGTLSAQVPNLISYQGYVTDTSGNPLGNPTAVNRTVTFRIWNSPTASAAGNRLYSETQTVTIANGDFSVLVGAGTLADGSPTLANVVLPTECYLGVTVDDGNSSTADPEISPRQRMVSTAFTFRAKVAETVANGAVTTAMLANNAIDATKIANTTITNAQISTSAAIADSKLATISTTGKVANSATTATSANTANAIIARDGSGNFSAGIMTGIATSANTLTTLLPVSLGGTGSATQNFVDLTAAQSIAGAKTFTATGAFTATANIGPSSGLGTLNVGARTADHLAMNGNNVSAYGGSNGNEPRTLNLNYSGGNVTTNAGATTGNFGIRTASAPRSILELSPATGTLDGIILGKTDDTASRFVGIHGGTVSLAAGSGFSGLEFGGPDSPTMKGYLAFHTHDSGVNSGERMRIDKNGNVGIGTNAPSSALQVVGRLNATTAIIGSGNVNSAPLQVNSQGTAGIGNHRTYGESGAENASATSSATASIYAAGFINAAGFRAFSDERIKNISGVTSGAEDLKTLLGVEVTNYTYKDVVARGNKSQKKLIAQQVESVYPAAVSRGTDCVPDIYKMAEINDGWVSLKTNLKVGERVRLMADKEEGVHEVLEVREGSFRTAFAPKDDSIFVFGRLVEDFRMVDYEAISMLNVSATQEIARRLEAKTAEVAALEARVKKLEARDKARDAKLAAFEKLLNAMDKPAARTASLK